MTVELRPFSEANDTDQYLWFDSRGHFKGASSRRTARILSGAQEDWWWLPLQLTLKEQQAQT